MTRILHHVFVIILFLAGSVPSLSQINTIRLSFDKAIEMALEQNTDVIISRMSTDQSEFLLKESKGNFLPKLSAYGDYTRNIDRAVIFFPNNEGSINAVKIGSDNTFNAGLSLSLPAYSRYNNSYKDYAYANQNLKREIDRGTKMAIVTNVKKAYYAYVVTLASISVMEKGLKNAEENLKNVQDRLEQGIVTEFDETSAKVQVATARNKLLEAESNIIPSANQLKLLLGINAKDSIELTDNLMQEQYPIDLVESENVLYKNSEIRQKELQVELADQQMEMTKANYYPTLNVIGNYQYLSQADDFDIGQYDWVKTSSMGLQLRIPLFNGMITKNKVQQTSIEKQIAEKQKQYTATSNQMAYAEILNQLDFAKQRVGVQQENKALAQRALEMAKERYNYGKSTFLEVNDAELSLTQTQLNWLQAILDYKSAYYDYELLMGLE